METYSVLDLQERHYTNTFFVQMFDDGLFLSEVMAITASNLINSLDILNKISLMRAHGWDLRVEMVSSFCNITATPWWTVIQSLYTQLCWLYSTSVRTCEIHLIFFFDSLIFFPKFCVFCFNFSEFRVLWLKHILSSEKDFIFISAFWQLLSYSAFYS